MLIHELYLVIITITITEIISFEDVLPTARQKIHTNPCHTLLLFHKKHKYLTAKDSSQLGTTGQLDDEVSDLLNGPLRQSVGSMFCDSRQ